jgi:RNA recognition motif-containing protein
VNQTRSYGLETCPTKYLILCTHSQVAKDDLDVLFRQHGTIVDIKLLDKGPHVYAFVEYEKQDSAVEAYEKYSNSLLLDFKAAN